MYHHIIQKILMLLLLTDIQADLKVRNLYFYDGIVDQYPNQTWVSVQTALKGQDIVQVQGINGLCFPQQWEANIQRGKLGQKHGYAHSWTKRKSTSFFYNRETVRLIKGPYNVDLRQQEAVDNVAVAEFKIHTSNETTIALASAVSLPKKNNSFDWVKQISRTRFLSGGRIPVVMIGSFDRLIGYQLLQILNTKTTLIPIKINNKYSRRVSAITPFGLDSIGNITKIRSDPQATLYNQKPYMHRLGFVLSLHDVRQKNVSSSTMLVRPQLPGNSRKQSLGGIYSQAELEGRQPSVQNTEYYDNSHQSTSFRPSSSYQHGRVGISPEHPQGFLRTTAQAYRSPTLSGLVETHRSPLSVSPPHLIADDAHTTSRRWHQAGWTSVNEENIDQPMSYSPISQRYQCVKLSHSPPDAQGRRKPSLSHNSYDGSPHQTHIPAQGQSLEGRVSVTNVELRYQPTRCGSPSSRFRRRSFSFISTGALDAQHAAFGDGDQTVECNTIPDFLGADEIEKFFEETLQPTAFLPSNSQRPTGSRPSSFPSSFSHSPPGAQDGPQPARSLSPVHLSFSPTFAGEYSNDRMPLRPAPAATAYYFYTGRADDTADVSALQPQARPSTEPDSRPTYWMSPGTGTHYWRQSPPPASDRTDSALFTAVEHQASPSRSASPQSNDEEDRFWKEQFQT